MYNSEIHLYHHLKEVYNQFSLRKRQIEDRFNMEIRSLYIEEKLDDYFHSLDIINTELKSDSIGFIISSLIGIDQFTQFMGQEGIDQFTQFMEQEGIDQFTQFMEQEGIDQFTQLVEQEGIDQFTQLVEQEGIDRFIQLMEEYHLFLAEYPQVRLRELQKELAQMEEETPKHKERALLQEKLRSLEAFLK